MCCCTIAVRSLNAAAVSHWPLEGPSMGDNALDAAAGKDQLADCLQLLATLFHMHLSLLNLMLPSESLAVHPGSGAQQVKVVGCSAAGCSDRSQPGPARGGRRDGGEAGAGGPASQT